jgi:hypothetical protein
MNVSPANSKLLYGTRPYAKSDGQEEIVIKVRLRDEKNNPIPNRQAELIADRDDVDITQPPPTDSDGLATGIVRATTPGPVNIRAVVFPPTNSSSST